MCCTGIALCRGQHTLRGNSWKALIQEMSSTSDLQPNRCSATPAGGGRASMRNWDCSGCGASFSTDAGIRCRCYLFCRGCFDGCCLLFCIPAFLSTCHQVCQHAVAHGRLPRFPRRQLCQQSMQHAPRLIVAAVAAAAFAGAACSSAYHIFRKPANECANTSTCVSVGRHPSQAPARSSVSQQTARPTGEQVAWFAAYLALLLKLRSHVSCRVSMQARAEKAALLPRLL